MSFSRNWCGIGSYQALTKRPRRLGIRNSLRSKAFPFAAVFRVTRFCTLLWRNRFLLLRRSDPLGFVAFKMGRRQGARRARI
jgi:hypothetical protein